jgi:protein-S-isoprenylcysteine O-methyltransferase Ste14
MVSGVTFSAALFFWRPVSGVLWDAQGAAHWVLTLLFLACLMGAYYTSRFIDWRQFMGVRALLRVVKNKPPKPQILSTSGPYAYCRHPMYAFLLAVLWIGPTMTYGRLEFATIATTYILIGALLEERSLRAEMGIVYDLYKANVPMWIPRLRPWRYDAGLPPKR